MENEWKPVYLDIQHLENMCIRYYQANERNMAEKIQAQSDLQKSQERIRELEGLLNKSENLLLYMDSYLKDISVRRNDIAVWVGEKCEYLQKRGKNG